MVFERGSAWVRNLVMILAVLALLPSCATNPATGKSELMLISESREIRLGEENYGPARQMQGGDYNADPAVTEYVREIGQKIAAVSDRKLPYEFVVLNSPEVNAWMMPGGKMAINRGMLLTMNSEAELAAVIGHEIAHATAKHGAKKIQEAMLIQGAVALTSIAIQTQVEDPLVRQLGVLGTQVAAQLISAKFSRDDEREADHYGTIYMSRAGYDPQGAVKMQEILLAQSKNRPDDLFTRLLASHPPSEERIKANRALAAELPTGGQQGAQAYHERLAGLFRAAPAYEAYEQGRAALRAGDYAAARALADKAIAIEPREASFYLLRG